MSDRMAIGEARTVDCPFCGGPAYEQGFGYRETPTLFSGICTAPDSTCGGWVDPMSCEERQIMVQPQEPQ